MDENEGLRARKQRQTREAIHRAAVRLATEHGPDTATVADISAAAEISPRTFFNYYPSKEDAIVGFRDDLPSDDELDAFSAAAGDALLRDVIDLLRCAFPPSDEETRTRRRALVKAHPTLLQRQWGRLVALEQRVGGAVATRMRRSTACEGLTDIDRAAQFLVMTASGMLRLAVADARTEPFNPDVPLRLDDDVTTLREVLLRFS